MSLTNLLLESTERVTPLSTLTALSGFVTDKPLGAFTQFLIKRFIKAFNINMDEIAEKDLSKYKTFNDFFTRKLQDGARPIDYNCKAVSPVDGTVGEASSIKAGRLIQAKGLDYSLQALVGGNKQDSAMFEDGNFVGGGGLEVVKVGARIFEEGHFNVIRALREFAHPIVLREDGADDVELAVGGEVAARGDKEGERRQCGKERAKVLFDFHAAPPVRTGRFPLKISCAE